MVFRKGWHYLFPIGLSLAGFAVTRHYPSDWSVAAFFWVMQYLGTIITTQYIIESVLAQAYMTQLNSKYVHEKPREEEIVNWNTGKVVEPLPPIKVDGNVVYTQAVTLPKFDKERSFAVTLIRMYEFNPVGVDMTQAKWVKTGKFVRAEFVGMLDKWAGHGVIVRASEKKNAPYRVERWDAVRLIANGNPLPPLLR